jgi:hypothetical protein
MKNLLIVTLPSKGGVSTILSNLYRGLKADKYNVDFAVLGRSIPSTLYKDLKLIKKIERFDIVIYMGSIAWPSHYFVKSKKALFVHGFVQDEFLGAFSRGNVHGKLADLFLLGYWKLFNETINKLDFFICHSVTACEANGIRNNFVILPQFILQDDVAIYTKFPKYRTATSGKAVKIVTYTSFARSPRLLKPEHIRLLAEKLCKLTSKKFDLYVIDPTGVSKSTNSVKVLPFLPKIKFLELVASSDLYIEGCIDEELRYNSMEAGLLGIPVAKITRPQYLERQDYDSRHLIIASSVTELAERVAECIENIDHHKAYYGKHIREFVLNNRLWDNVKKPLIRGLGV